MSLEIMTMENGTIINQYKIISPIGKGGMGEVYLAEDTKLDRRVALKILPAEFSEDKDRMSRFVREAKSTSALNHPNIITIHEIGESEGTHFIATEFIDGKTLNDYAKSNSLDFKVVLEIAIQIASALDEAHSARIVHRDIKPDNIMIRSMGLAKILDFGIAKFAAPTESDAEAATAIHVATTPGMIIGSANYMSPEQAKGQSVDARTDIFSFGVVLYEMIAGHLPFEGATAMEMIGAILKDDAKPLDSSVPTEITRITNKCLRKDRNERYQTIKDVLNDLMEVKLDLEFQVKLERSDVPHKDENRTQILQASTLGETSQVTANQTLQSKPAKKYLAIALAILLISVIGFFAYRNFTTTKQIESIAVMPFVNEGGNQEVEYLSDGMTDMLINRLSQLPNLSVKSRSSVFRYKGKEFDSKKIASELNVQAILNGRVVQRVDQLSLNLELIDAHTENVIWSESYDRKQSDLVTLQSEIARDVSARLKTTISGTDEAKVADNGTVNSEAYQSYLKGRYFLSKGTSDAIQQGLKFFQDSVSLDPKFARGYAGIADAYSLLGTVFAATIPAAVAMPNARTAAEKAIELDPNLGEAYTSLAWVKYRFDWDWAGAESDFKKAVQPSPSYAQAHQWYGDFLLSMNREQEAIAEMKKARDLEPFSLIINWNLAKVYFGFRRFDEAVTEAKNVLEMDEKYLRNYRILRVSDERKGMDAEAFETGLKERQLLGDNPERIALYKTIFKSSGLKAFIAKEADVILQDDPNNLLPPFNKAHLYVSLGDTDKALYWLGESYKAHSGPMVGLQIEVEFDSLRNETRFKELIQKMNFPN